ncbi:MAG: hypothetical protein WCI02_12630 [Planctomycetota bacterium]
MKKFRHLLLDSRSVTEKIQIFTRLLLTFVMISCSMLANFATTSAAVIMTQSQSDSVYPVSATDLLHGIAPTSKAQIFDEEGLNSDTSGISLTNGSFGPLGLTGANAEVSIIHNGGLLVYDLPFSTNIFEIATYTGWRDSGRSKQDFTVSVSTDSGLSWNFLYNVASEPGGMSQEVRLIDSVGAPLAVNINAIKFEFWNTQNGYVGYREIDVFGSPAVPEPSMMVIGTLFGLGGLMAKRRMKK